MRVREVPVLPVPATAPAPTRAAPGTPVAPTAAARDDGVAWGVVVRSLFATRSAAFAAGRPDLLSAADAPGSALLAADRELFDREIRQAGYTRAEGLSFDLDSIHLLAVGPRDAELEVGGRQGAYVLSGRGRNRTVAAAGPRRVLTLQLTRTSPAATWLLAAGSYRAT